MCTTTFNGRQIASWSSLDTWYFEVKDGGEAKPRPLEIRKINRVFERPKTEYNVELDPFEETLPRKNENRPYLTCLYYSTENKTPSTLTSNKVPKKFFKSLFGRSAITTSNEVVLIGLPDGRTFWASVTSDNSILNAALIANLDQCIISIKYVKEGLIIVGVNGKICLPRPLNERKDSFYVPGPLKSFNVHRDTFYYLLSNGNIKISKFVTDENGSLIINVSNTKINDAEKIVSDASQDALFYINKDGGEMKLIRRDLEEDFTKISAKKILENIEKQANDIKELNTELEYIKKLLHNTSLAAWFKAKLPKEFEQACSLNVNFKSDGSYDLIVTVRNLHAFAATNNWHLRCNVTNISESECHSICKTVKINSADTSCDININLNKINVPLKLTCALVVSPSNSYVGKYKQLESTFPMCFDLWGVIINELALLNTKQSDYHHVPLNYDENTAKTLFDIAQSKNKVLADQRLRLNQQNFVNDSNDHWCSFAFRYASLSKILSKAINSLEARDVIKLITSKSLIRDFNSNDNISSYWYRNIPIYIKASSIRDANWRLTLTCTSLFHLVSLRQSMVDQFQEMFKIIEAGRNSEMTKEFEAPVDLNSLNDKARQEMKKLNRTCHSNVHELIELYREIRRNLSSTLTIF